MSFLVDKNEVRLAEGDYIDVRLRIVQCDEIGRKVVARLGGGNLGLGNGTTNPSPDAGVVLQFKPGDVLKVP